MKNLIKIYVGYSRKLLNIYENIRQQNRKSLCIRGIFSVYKRTNHILMCNIKCSNSICKKIYIITKSKD